MRKVLDAADSGTPSIFAILQADLEPVLLRRRENASYRRLAGRVATEPSDTVRRVFNEVYSREATVFDLALRLSALFACGVLLALQPSLRRRRVRARRCRQDPGAGRPAFQHRRHQDGAPLHDSLARCWTCVAPASTDGPGSTQRPGSTHG